VGDPVVGEAVVGEAVVGDSVAGDSVAGTLLVLEWWERRWLARQWWETPWSARQWLARRWWGTAWWARQWLASHTPHPPTLKPSLTVNMRFLLGRLGTYPWCCLYALGLVGLHASFVSVRFTTHTTCVKAFVRHNRTHSRFIVY